ncbi:hypothetical protein [Dactylosporangium salmoneum]|uniref:Uncharacterized protein n=1 Tax=Dactylosporangium salmoneum TaxID=53361 RepID=A0ABP5SHA6_9ACTN
MGFWGTLITARAERLPPALEAHGAVVRDHEGARRGDGWRVFGIPDNLLGDSLDPLLGLVAATSSPVLTAYIADSDHGQVIAASPHGDPWGVWLDRQTAYAFERDHHVMSGASRAAARRRARDMIAGFGCPPAKATRHAVDWAAEAGYRVPPAPIRRLLRTARRPGLGGRLRLPSARYEVAEDLYFTLLDHLGLPRAPGSPDD